MKDGTQETNILDVIYCRAFKKMMITATCNQCDDFGGIHEEPEKAKDENNQWVIIGTIRYVICKRPRHLKIEPIGEVKDGDN